VDRDRRRVAAAAYVLVRVFKTLRISSWRIHYLCLLVIEGWTSHTPLDVSLLSLRTVIPHLPYRHSIAPVRNEEGGRCYSGVARDSRGIGGEGTRFPHYAGIFRLLASAAVLEPFAGLSPGRRVGYSRTRRAAIRACMVKTLATPACSITPGGRATDGKHRTSGLHVITARMRLAYAYRLVRGACRGPGRGSGFLYITLLIRSL